VIDGLVSLPPEKKIIRFSTVLPALSPARIPSHVHLLLLLFYQTLYATISLNGSINNSWIYPPSSAFLLMYEGSLVKRFEVGHPFPTGEAGFFLDPPESCEVGSPCLLYSLFLCSSTLIRRHRRPTRRHRPAMVCECTFPLFGWKVDRSVLSLGCARLCRAAVFETNGFRFCVAQVLRTSHPRADSLFFTFFFLPPFRLKLLRQIPTSSPLAYPPIYPFLGPSYRRLSSGPFLRPDLGLRTNRDPITPIAVGISQYPLLYDPGEQAFSIVTSQPAAEATDA